jgi:CDP-diacylglycerol---glycerol-3-phosphate 3-phosphatidyltransferase
MIKKEYINLANMLTLSRMVCGFIFLALFLVVQDTGISHFDSLIIQIISFLIFTFAIVSDGLDGYFARKNNQVSDFGKHFDPLSDSIFFIIVFFTFTIIKLMPWYFLLLIVLREGFMHIFLRPYVMRKGFTLPASIFGKVKTVFQCTFSFIILAALMFKEIIGIFNINIVNLYKIIEITSYFFFLIIVILSLTSLISYLLNLKNVLNPQK